MSDFYCVVGKEAIAVFPPCKKKYFSKFYIEGPNMGLMERISVPIEETENLGLPYFKFGNFDLPENYKELETIHFTDRDDEYVIVEVSMLTPAYINIHEYQYGVFKPDIDASFGINEWLTYCYYFKGVIPGCYVDPVYEEAFEKKCNELKKQS